MTGPIDEAAKRLTSCLADPQWGLSSWIQWYAEVHIELRRAVLADIEQEIETLRAKANAGKEGA